MPHRTFLSAVLLAFLPATTALPQEKPLARFVVHNTLDEPVAAASVTVPFRSEWTKTPCVLMHEGGTLVPFQFDDLTGDDKPEELFFQLDLPAGDSVAATLWATAEPLDPPKRVHAFVQETDALVRPVWESEVMGFCSYGAAKLDVFGKGRPGLTGESFFPKDGTVPPPSFGADANMNFVPVGFTLGAGGLFLSEFPGDRSHLARPWTANSLQRRELARPHHDAQFEFKVLAAGPIRAIVQSHITRWQAELGQYEVRLLYLMEAGKRYCEVRAQLLNTATKAHQLLLGTGYARLSEEKMFDFGDTWMGSVSGGVANQRGLALWWERDAKEAVAFTEEDGGNHTVLLNPDSKRSARWWHGAAWDKDGGLTSAEQWRAYVEKTARQLANPPVAMVENAS